MKLKLFRTNLYEKQRVDCKKSPDFVKIRFSSIIKKKLQFWHKNLLKKKYAEQHLTCTGLFCWSFFYIFCLNKKKRSRITVSPLLPTRPRAPSVWNPVPQLSVGNAWKWTWISAKNHYERWGSFSPWRLR